MKKSIMKTAVPTFSSTFTHILNISGLIIKLVSPTIIFVIFQYFQQIMQKKVFEFESL